MPRIHEYNEQVNATTDIPGRRAQASDFGGEGLLHVGKSLGHVGDIVQETAERQEVSDVHAKLAQARAEWTVHLQERSQAAAPGDPTFAPKFNEDFSKYLQTLEGGLQTKGAQFAFRKGAADLSAHFVESAGVYQAKMMGAKAKQDYLVSLDANRNTLLSDPTQFGAVLNSTLQAINDPSGIYAKMPAADRAQLEIQTKQQLALSAVQGTIQNGAAELAKRQLMEGKWDGMLDADKKHQLIAEADVGIRAKDTAAERQRLTEKHELEKKQKAVADNFLARIITPGKDNGGPLSDKEIIANPILDAAQKQHYIDYKLRVAKERAEGGEARSNPAAVRELMLDIHAADNDPRKTYNTDKVMARFAKGDITISEAVFLRKEVEQMRDGNTQGFAKDVNNARGAVYTALTRSIVGSTQPEVAADAAYRFNKDLETAIERKRKANEDPRVLLDPTSKEYMLAPARVQSYLPIAREALRQGADAVRRGTLTTKKPASYKDFDALKSGDEFTDPQGNIRRKP